MIIRALIVDDEQHCIDRLSELLTTDHSESIQPVGSSRSVEEGIDAIKTFQPDVVFLDVQLHDKTGFDLLRKLDKVPLHVIFTTAFEKYAVQAFKFSAIDYLLKPVDRDDLALAVGKLREKISQKDMSRKLDTLFHNLKNVEGASKRIAIPTLHGLTFLEVKDIIRCQSDINYTTIYLKDKQQVVVAKTLKEFEELLTEYNFYRVHNSHLINLARIKSYNKGKGGVVCMMDGSEIDVSIRKKSEFLKKLENL